MEKKELWEIFVPTIFNNGTPIRTKYHKAWDKKVYDVTGGLTILMPTKGKWVSPNGDLFHERMIPVRIACNHEQIMQIVKMTCEYYDQLAIMAYKISDEVIIYHKP